MNTRALSLTAVGLWVVTVAVAAWFFVAGRTVPAPDGRQAIVLSTDEKNLILAEMHTMLVSVQGVVDGVASKNMQRVAQAARQSGSAATARVPASVKAKLPLGFKRLGNTVRQGFDEIVVGAESAEPTDFLLARLGDQLDNCVGCHAAYRLGAVAAE